MGGPGTKVGTRTSSQRPSHERSFEHLENTGILHIVFTVLWHAYNTARALFYIIIYLIYAKETTFNSNEAEYKALATCYKS